MYPMTNVEPAQMLFTARHVLQSPCMRVHYNKNNFHACIRDDHSNKSTRFHIHGGAKALIFSSDELHSYASSHLHEQQHQFWWCVKKDNKQSLHLNEGDILCSVPLNALTPKLTLKAANKLANSHDMYMPSKILLKKMH
jgi:hypothetical protein